MKTVNTGLLALLAAVALLFAGATLVQAATEEIDGVGDILIYPLYLADSAAYTEFTLVNTAGATTSVHIQIKSQGDSQDQLDFCIDMTKNDVYKAKISSDGAGGAILTTLNNIDYLDPNGDKIEAPDGYPYTYLRKAEGTYNLDANDLSDCSYGTQKGYIVAYAVSNCNEDGNLTSGNAIMGNTRIIETATSKIMSLNAVAIAVTLAEAAADDFAAAQLALCKDQLYMMWEFEKTAAVLTVPSIGTEVSTNSQWCDVNDNCLIGSDEGVLDNEFEGCGLAQLQDDFETLYNLDEKPFSKKSPHYYPANEVSIVNFADAGSNTDSTNFFINGGPVNWGLSFTSASLTEAEGWTRWVIPSADINGVSMLPQHNVIGTYFMITKNSLAWMPCQYEACGN